MNSYPKKADEQTPRCLVLYCLISSLIAVPIDQQGLANVNAQSRRTISVAALSTTPSYTKQGFAGVELITTHEDHRSVQGKLLAGHSYSYRVTIPTNYYVEVSLIPKGIRTVNTILRSDGSKLAEVQLTPRDEAPAFLAVITDSSGYCDVQVRSLEKLVIGEFEFLVEPPLPAKEREKERVAAHQLYAEGSRLSAIGTADSIGRALKAYQASLLISRRLSDQPTEASALIATADTLQSQSRYQEALQYYNEALKTSQGSPNQRPIVLILNRISCLYVNIGDILKAREAATEAYRISSETNDSRGQAQSLCNLGLVAYNLGEPQRALECFNTSLQTWEYLCDRVGKAQTLLQKGCVYADLGQIQEALHLFNESLDLSESVGDPKGKALAHTAIGGAYCLLGEYQTALDFHNQASAAFRTLGDRNGEAITCTALGYVYETLGDSSRALQLYKKSLGIFQAIGRRTQVAHTIGSIARIYHELNYSRAVAYYEEKLRLSNSFNDWRMQAYTLRELGDVFESHGNSRKALDYYNRALSLSRSMTDLRAEAYILNKIGSIYSKQVGNTEKASIILSECLQLMKNLEDRAGEASVLYNLARLKRDMGDLKVARTLADNAIGISESLRTNVLIPELRTSYLASVFKYYQFYIDLLMQLHKQEPLGGFDAAAFEINEMARSRSLLDILVEARVDIRKGVPKELTDRERELQQRVNGKATLKLRLSSKGPDDARIEDEMEGLVAEYREVQAEIRARSPRYAALAAPSPLSIEQVQHNLLDSDTLLLEYSLGDERSYVWAVTNTSVTSLALPARREIESLARRLCNVLLRNNSQMSPKTHKERMQLAQMDAEYRDLSARLSRILIQPLGSQLCKKRLLIVPDGVLQHLPFAALPDINSVVKNAGSFQPLIVAHEIQYSPSASVLALLRQDAKTSPRSTKTIAVVADPVYDIDDDRVRGRARQLGDSRSLSSVQSVKKSVIPAGNRDSITRGLRFRGDVTKKGGIARFPRLYSARWEASKILSLVSRDQSLQALGFDANKDTVTDPKLSQYRILHFATHGIIDDEHPELSGIVLSLVDSDGRPRDGFLRLNEIYNLKLSADLVVLSACHTSVGKAVRGEGLIGLTRGFMYAGTPRIVASLWAVDDRATAELMVAFYRGMLLENMTPTAALRHAQIEMWKNNRWKQPYFWAPFIIQGDWR